MIHTIEILGITVSEPTTMVTDYMITAVAWWAGAKLASGSVSNAKRLWCLGFVFIGFGAFLGGTSHGFAAYLSDTAYTWIWKATVYSIGLSMLFAVAGTVEGSGLGRVARATAHGLNLAGFTTYAVWMINHGDFIYVIYHYVPAMIGIALIQVWGYLRNRLRSAPWIVAGVVVTLLGAVIQQSGITLHRHFNHNDLYHVIQIGGLYLLHRGTSLLD